MRVNLEIYASVRVSTHALVRWYVSSLKRLHFLGSVYFKKYMSQNKN